MSRALFHILWYVNLFSAACLLLAYLSVFVSPEWFWPLAFFGLAYPIFFFINLGFCLFWLIRWKRQLWLSLLVLILGWNYHSSFVQVRGKAEDANTPGIRVLSYNVRLFNLYRWEDNSGTREQIFDFIHMETPDVICFQELYVSDDSSFNTRRLLRELQSTPYYQFTPEGSGRSKTHSGLATFSAFPILKQGVIVLPGERSYCIFSDLLWEGDTLRIYNNHLQSNMISSNQGWFQNRSLIITEDSDIDELKDISMRLRQAFKYRAQQVQIIRKHIAESPYPVIVCGDFNDSPISYTYQKMKKNLKDAFMESGSGFGKTYRGDLPSYRIDYIFHSRSLFSHSFSTHRVDMSDHYPISCIVRRKGTKSQ